MSWNPPTGVEIKSETGILFQTGPLVLESSTGVKIKSGTGDPTSPSLELPTGVKIKNTGDRRILLQQALVPNCSMGVKM
jgi:hypothetical protein